MSAKPRLVMIEWLDSHSFRGWQTAETLKQSIEPLYCRSVGWLIAKHKDCTVIVAHVGGERFGDQIMQACGDMTIPNKAIINISNLAVNCDAKRN